MVNQEARHHAVMLTLFDRMKVCGTGDISTFKHYTETEILKRHYAKKSTHRRAWSSTSCNRPKNCAEALKYFPKYGHGRIHILGGDPVVGYSAQAMGTHRVHAHTRPREFLDRFGYE